MNAKKRQKRKDSNAGHVRIIAGKWRGRKLSLAPSDKLRPTPDRVRETVFNWLSPYLVGASCLDLFAGTGALGFEALSRGAQQSVLVENDQPTADLLQHHVTALGASNAVIFNVDAAAWVRHNAPTAFDIVFLDPPFRAGLIEVLLDELASGWLKQKAWVYLESEKLPILHLQENNWQIVRQSRTRHVEFALVQQPQ